MIGILFSCTMIFFGLFLLFAIFEKLQNLKNSAKRSPTPYMKVLNASALFMVVFVSFFVSVTFLESYLQFKYSGNRFRGNPGWAGGNHPQHLVISDSTRGYKLQPNFQGTEISIRGEFEVPVTINSIGMRDREHDINAGQLRIVGLGDSFVYGEGVRIEDSFLWLLERKFNSMSPELPVDIYKAGVPAYSLEQEFNTLKELCLTSTPDWVLLGVSTNRLDRLDEPFSYYQGFVIRTDHIPDLHQVRGNLYKSTVSFKPLLSLHLFLEANLYSINFFRFRLDTVEKMYKSGRKYIRQKLFSGNEEDTAITSDTFEYNNVEQGLNILEKFQDLSKKYNFNLFVFVYEGDKKETYFEEFCRANDIPCCNVTEFLNKAKARGESVTFKKDFHWNERGHELVADFLYEEFVGYLTINPDAKQ